MAAGWRLWSIPAMPVARKRRRRSGISLLRWMSSFFRFWHCGSPIDPRRPGFLLLKSYCWNRGRLMRMFHLFLVCACLLGPFAAHAAAGEARVDSAKGLIAANETASTTTDADFDAAFGDDFGAAGSSEKLINDPLESVN